MFLKIIENFKTGWKMMKSSICTQNFHAVIITFTRNILNAEFTDCCHKCCYWFTDLGIQSRYSNVSYKLHTHEIQLLPSIKVHSLNKILLDLPIQLLKLDKTWFPDIPLFISRTYISYLCGTYFPKVQHKFTVDEANYFIALLNVCPNRNIVSFGLLMDIS